MNYTAVHWMVDWPETLAETKYVQTVAPTKQTLAQPTGHVQNDHTWCRWRQEKETWTDTVFDIATWPQETTQRSRSGAMITYRASNQHDCMRLRQLQCTVRHQTDFFAEGHTPSFPIAPQCHDTAFVKLCLCVCKISQKAMNGFWWNFEERWSVTQGEILHFGGDPDSVVDPGSFSMILYH